MGYIPLPFIYQIIASDIKSTSQDAFSVSSTMCFKKKIEKRGRTLLFGCKSSFEMEDWIITIEFLRTKAIYDNYAEKNIPFEFTTQ